MSSQFTFKVPSPITKEPIVAKKAAKKVVKAAPKKTVKKAPKKATKKKVSKKGPIFGTSGKGSG